MAYFNVSNPAKWVYLYSKISTLKIMKTVAKRSEVKGSTYLVKLRIDARTVIMVRTKESLKNWKAKYPDAVEVI